MALSRNIYNSLLIAGCFASCVSASDYGTTGLVDIPTARVAGDAQLKSSVAFDGLHRSFMLTYQATPWLETTFRYTGFYDFFFWDRNYEFKVLMHQESQWLPAVAMGVRDAVGTGVFGSEYLVASKQWGQFDLTLGLGWGRLAGKGDFTNPLSFVADRFEVRPKTSEFGGEFNIDTFFSGQDVGVFGGLEYSFKSWPVRAILEYNPDQYDVNVVRGRKPSLRPESPITVGFSWEPISGIEMLFSYQHLEDFGFSFSAVADTAALPKARAAQVFESSVDLSVGALPSQINPKRWYDRLLYDVERSGLLLVSGRISADGRVAELAVGNKDYPLWVDALKQHLALADLHLPPSVNTIYFTLEDGGHQLYSVKMRRPSAAQSASGSAFASVDVLGARSDSGDMNRTSFVTNKFNVSANISNRLQLFDPDDPARYQFYLDVDVDYNLTNYLVLKGSYGLDITNNFNESRRKQSDSVLPKVRSDIVKYLTQGETGLDALFLDYRRTLAPDFHARAFGGVLEEMYSGVGGELLYWPFDARIAFGLSVNWVKQRDFDKSLKHLEYSTTTAFLSGYWASPLYNFDVGVHLGRFLAKDLGGTLELRRTFDNGWQVGVWATLTDVPFEQFGEGSFDKGFFFQVPLDGIFGASSRTKYSTRVRPIQRDGGQRLENHSANLFWDMRAARMDAVTNNLIRLRND
jgi:hypothetical protein